jgi:hypothetical protein
MILPILRQLLCSFLLIPIIFPIVHSGDGGMVVLVFYFFLLITYLLVAFCNFIVWLINKIFGFTFKLNYINYLLIWIFFEINIYGSSGEWGIINSNSQYILFSLNVLFSSLGAFLYSNYKNKTAEQE